MSIYIGKFNNRFDEAVDQIKERICIGNELYYNGIEKGDYVFPTKNGQIADLWMVEKFEDKKFNNEIVNTAFFQKIKSFEPALNLEELTRFKDFTLDMNLLNKAIKPTKGIGFYKIGYEKDFKEIEKANIREEKRKFYIALRENKLMLANRDILVRVDNIENTKIEGFFEFINGELKENESLTKLYEEREKYTLKELLEFASENKDNAKNKRNFLEKVIMGLEKKGVFEIDKPLHLYDNIIVGRVVTPSGKKELGDIVVNEGKKIWTKKVDKSLLEGRVTIPVEVQEKILEHLDQELERGKSKNITYIIEGKKFEGKIQIPDIKNREDRVIQFIFLKRGKEFIKQKFKKTYEYIVEFMKKNENKAPKDFKNEEFIEFYLTDKQGVFLLKPISSKVEDRDEEEILEEIFEDVDKDEDYIIKEEVENIYNFIREEGYEYDIDLIKNLYTSIKTKPFVILSGISGTGKSKIIELFAKAIGATSKNNRFKLIPVKPDWSDSSDILGYRNIEGEFIPRIISEICYKAMLNPELPYFICLDEMNLARVEYYFSDILSLIETRRSEEGNVVTDNILSKDMFGKDLEAMDKYGDIIIPENLYIVGTVNMDETTFQFSKKVLDRANTIEFNKVNLEYDFDFIATKEVVIKEYKNNFLKAEFIKLKDCIEYREIINKIIEKLIEINKVLEKYNQHFAYRVRDEIIFYVIYMVREELMSFDEAMDKGILQKILPKISGSNDDVLEMLCKVFNLLSDIKIKDIDELDIEEVNGLKEKIEKYKESNEKILYMIRRYLKDGFTTFWR